jgi:hypothetical protein
MEPFRDDQDLIAELRELRPKPSQDFAAELDERAVAGFPRRSARTSSPLAGLFAQLRNSSPRRLAFSAGATVLAAIAVATVVVAVGEPETNSSLSMRLAPLDQPIPNTEAPRHSSDVDRSAAQSAEADQSRSHGGEGSSGIQYLSAPPVATEAPSREMSGEASAGAAEGGIIPFSRGFNSSSKLTGPYASKAVHRKVERSAEMVLGAEPTDVAGDAADVFDAVHAVDGIVLSSSVSGAAAGDAGARFDLLIPSAKLGDALADFSAIDTVVSRHEATDDITAPAVRVGEHLRDSQAKIDGLLVQLAGADSDEERAKVEAELRVERRHAAALRSQATKLDRRANLSRVSLRIETGAAATSPDEDGSWGAGDALDDAGHILGIAAGVAIVGLAVLAPLALIALLAWLANRARLRRARERALA